STFEPSPSVEISSLSLHDALPICEGLAIETGPRLPEEDGTAEMDPDHQPDDRDHGRKQHKCCRGYDEVEQPLRIESRGGHGSSGDRKSTRLNSSHVKTSYAVFCLK